MTKQLPDLLTVPQVADYLQMSIPTIRRWVAEGRIQSIKIGRARRIPREVVLNPVSYTHLDVYKRQSADRKPTLADLRDSGELEQDADVVMLLHRPGYHDEEANQNEAWLYLEKNREGPTGPVRLFWDEKKVRFFSTDTRRGDV